MKTWKKVLPKWLAVICLILACSMTIGAREAQAKSVKLSATKKTLNVGKSFTLKLKNYKGKKLSWTYNNTSVISLKKQSGAKFKVTAKNPGKSVITIKAGKKKYKCTVTVKGTAADTAKLNFTTDKTSLTLKAGQTGKIKVTLKVDGDIAYELNDSSIVSAAWDEEGWSGRSINVVVKALKKGTAELKFTDGSSSRGITVKVTVQ